MMSIIYKILKILLPERLIRTLFITSLYTKLFNVKTLDIRIYHKVNKLLAVCNNDYACGAGMSLAQVFWNGVELQIVKAELNSENRVVLTKEAEEEIVSKIISRTPNWLIYNHADMVIDIKKMIENRLELKNITA